MFHLILVLSVWFIIFLFVMHFCTIAHNAMVFNNPDESLKLFVSLPSFLPPSGLLQAGLHSPATPILLPRLSSQTWLFAHSRELLFRLKFFGFLVALVSFCLQSCPKTLTRAVIPPNSEKHFKFNQPVKSPCILINGCFCLADKIQNFGV